ncbi:MAG: hypothetical protein HKN29_04735 [Rhodothermales bacterium]|nr:hypothetical protein [Rhodothermales bacterium]
MTAQADGLATDSAERPAGNTGDQGNTGRAETTQNTSRTGSGAPRVTGATILDARTNNATSLTGTETKTANANAGGETGTRSVAAPATAVQPEQASTATGRLAEAHTLSPTNSKPGSDQAGEQAHRQAVNLAPSEEATDAVKTSARAGSDQATRPAADQTSRTPADQATRPAAEQPNNTADTGRAAPSQTRVPGQPTEAAASPRPAPASQPLDPRPAPQQLDASRPALAFTEFDSTSESAPHPRFQLTDRDARPSGARANVSLSFASAQEPATTAKADRPVFTLRSLYDAGSAAADQPASAATAEASARALDSTPAGLARDLPGHAIDSGTTRPGNERTDSRESPAEMASREANATSPSAGGNAQGFSGGGDDARQQNAFAQPTGTQAIAGTTPAEAIFEMPSLDPASLDADSGHLLDNRILEVLDEWFGETSPTATDRALGGGRSRTGTVASAWLRAVRTAIKSDGPPQDPAAWKEVTIELEDGLGSVNIRARRDSDLLSLQIFTTDPTTGDKLSSATSRLESELRDRYGADVNLSFGSDGGHQQGDSAAAGSADRVNSISAGQGLDTSESNDSETRRGADRVWVG